MTRNELKIVSGAQTGVDQGGLLAAIDLGHERRAHRGAEGGVCPQEGRRTDGCHRLRGLRT